MSNTKLVFVGPVGAGKTTAVRTMVESEMVSTDELATDMTKQWKETTTVALDYGHITNNRAQKVHLYGLPGQERFKFMWDILSLGGHGVIVLLDNTRPTPFQDLRFYLDEFKKQAEIGAAVVAITKTDLNDSGPSLADYQREIEVLGYDLPVYTADPRSHESMINLISETMDCIGHDQVDVDSLCVA